MIDMYFLNKGKKRKTTCKYCLFQFHQQLKQNPTTNLNNFN